MSGLYVCSKISMRCRHDASIDLDVLGIAKSPDNVFLKNAQELHLQTQWQLSNFVEKERSSRGFLE